MSRAGASRGMTNVCAFLALSVDQMLSVTRSLAIGDKRCAMNFIKQAFGEYSQCSLEVLQLKDNANLGSSGVAELLFQSLADFRIDSLHTIDLAGCALSDHVCPPIVKFITRRKSDTR